MKTKKMVQLALLSALIAVMSFTPIGYFRTLGVEITLIPIPVAIGALVMGPGAGAFLGGVFGLSSFLQCFGMSAFGTALFQISPLFCAILCLLPRVLMGLVAGLVFRALNGRGRPKFWAYALGALSCALTNTVLFVAGLLLLYGGSDFIVGMMAGLPLLQFAVAFVGLNGLVEALACTVLAAPIARAVRGTARSF